MAKSWGRQTGAGEPGLWANRAFRWLWIGQSGNALGSFVSVVALPLVAVGRLRAPTFDVAALEAIEWLPALLIGLPVGALVDRSHHTRRIMMLANLGQAAALGSVPVTAALGVLSMPTLFLAALAAGLAGVFFQTAYSPYLRELVPTAQLMTANSRLQASQSTAQLTGPALGGLLVQLVGAATAVLVDAASFLFSWLCLWAVRTKTAPLPEAEPRALLRDIADGIQALWRDRLLGTLAVTTALANLLLTAMGAVEIVFLVRDVHVSSAAVGLLLTSSGVGGLVGALAAGRVERRFGTAGTARAALAVTAPFALLLSVARPGPSIALFVLGGFMASFGIAIAGITFLSLRQTVCPPRLLGRVSAGSRLLMSATIPAGALLGGVLGEHIGTRATLLVTAIAYSAVGVAAMASPLRHAPHLGEPSVASVGQASS